MSREIRNFERGHISFDELGEALGAYKAAESAYFQARYTNQVHDEEGFATISGQDLEDWREEFPRIDDDEVTRLQEAWGAAKNQLVEELGLASSEAIPGLVQACHDEETRRSLYEKLSRSDVSRDAIPVSSAYMGSPDLIDGIITMSRLTNQEYLVHGGLMAHNTYNYLCVTVGPASRTEDVIAQFAEWGIDLSAETNAVD